MAWAAEFTWVTRSRPAGAAEPVPCAPRSFRWFGAAFAVWAAVATGQRLYAGVDSRFGYSKEQTVAADVQSCNAVIR
jgi:hypothetical protein